MQELSRAAEWIGGARALAVLTGAGLSQESGVPTFRGPNGLWRRYRPEELATPEAFARDPRLVWEWYDWRRSLIARAAPNPAHRALAELEQRVCEFALLTQNVDGLEERAGCRHVLRLHGDIWLLRCVGCGREGKNRAVPLPELPPRCSCGALLRPGVVWFGEPLPADVLARAFAAAQRAEVFLVVGTSAVVQPAASLPLIAKQAGAHIVEINREETPLSSAADVSLFGLAGEILPRLVAHEVRP